MPSTIPHLISIFGAVLANFEITLAGAVASVLQIATAVGPSRLGVKLSNVVPAIALLI